MKIQNYKKEEGTCTEYIDFDLTAKEISTNKRIDKMRQGNH